MQNIIKTYLIILIAVFAVPFTAFAGREYWEVSTRDQLGVSLMSLKERAVKIYNRNVWLNTEIQKTNVYMRQMAQDLKDFTRYKNTWNGSVAEYDEKIRNMSLVEKRILRANMSIAQLNSEYRRLMIQLNVKKEQEVILRAKIVELSRPIEEYKQKEKGDKIKLNDVSPKISRYKVLVEESIKSLTKVNYEYRHIKNKYERPLQTIFRLKRTEKELVGEFNLLDDERSVFNDEESILNKQTEDIVKNRKNDVKALIFNIRNLSDKRNELTAMLVHAQQKIKGKRVKFSKNTKHTEQLAENLDAIRGENLVLQKKMTSLQKTLQKINIIQ